MSEKKEAIAALGGSGKRPRVHDAQLVTKLPKPVKTLVNEIAAKEGVTEATIVRRALGEFLERRGYNR